MNCHANKSTGCLSPSLMVPEHRLAVLLDQVKQSRIANCLYHNTEVSSSLYSDHRCDREHFPLEVAAELHQHTSEVWFVDFSHDGTRLVSCGAEGKALIWDMQSLQVLHTLPDHTQGVCFASWSPDDKMLITCSKDRYARLWDTEVSNSNPSHQRRWRLIEAKVWPASTDSQPV